MAIRAVGGSGVKKAVEHKGPRSPWKTERDRAKGKTKIKEPDLSMSEGVGDINADL